MRLTGQTWKISYLIVLLMSVVEAQQNQSAPFYTAISRWGQAATILDNTLFVFGGKTDPQRQFTYPSAPNNNDLLSLDLSSSFSVMSPPWTYVSGSQNQSTSQGPSVAFHTLTPYTTSQLLLFGGTSGFNSIQTNNDSAWLLTARSSGGIIWNSQTPGWASEPMRRLYHAAPAAFGAIYLIGGVKGDQSQLGFPDTYLFNAIGNGGSPIFLPLTNSTNAPSGLFGHAAHVLPNGKLLVFGGYFSEDPPVASSLSTIYVLDTTAKDLAWSIHNTTTESIPRDRRDFASTVLDDGRIFIHGGGDAALQIVYEDGAILDTTKDPMSWTLLDGLSDTLGPRVSHFAAAFNNQVLVGFGWTGNAPADATLACYDPKSGIFLSTYTAPAASPTITTLPVTPTAPGGTISSSGSGATKQSGSGPTKTTQSSTSTSPAGKGGDEAKSNKTGAVIGSVLGALAFVALVGAGVYYGLRRRERLAWMGINADVKRDEGRWKLMPAHDPWGIEDDSMYHGPDVQMAGSRLRTSKNHNRGILGLGPLIGMSGYRPSNQQRRDMLADEDIYQFDIDSAFHDGDNDHVDELGMATQRPKWRREDTGGTSLSYKTATWDALWNSSVLSLQNVGVSLGLRPTGFEAARQGKGEYVNPPEWWDKGDLSLEPFTDEAVKDLSTGPYETAMRPRGGEYSTSKASNPYVDPFANDEREQYFDDDREGLLAESWKEHGQSEKSLPSIPEGSVLARVNTSSSGPSDAIGGGSSGSQESTSFHTARSGGVLSNKSAGLGSYNSSLSSPISPRPTSLIGLSTSSAEPVRRSNTWWTRLSRSPFRDKLTYDPLHRRKSESINIIPEFRDPNPPPRLLPIEETSPRTSNPRGSPVHKSGSKRREGSESAASTKSSVKTGRTANTDLMEHFDGKMEVVQRALSRESRRTTSTGTTIDSTLEKPESSNKSSHDESHQRSWTTSSDAEAVSIIESPIEAPIRTTSPTFAGAGGTNTRGHLIGPRSPQASAGPVSPQLAVYEQQVSQEAVPHDGPRSPRRRDLSYGVALKSSLFIANPDQRNPSSAS